MGNTINIAAGAVVNIGQTDKTPERPSVPITPFLKATFLDMNKELLMFNTHVAKKLDSIDHTLITELLERLKDKASYFDTVARGDYSPEVLTEHGAEIAAIAFAVVLHYGGELAIG